MLMLETFLAGVTGAAECDLHSDNNITVKCSY